MAGGRGVRAGRGRARGGGGGHEAEEDGRRGRLRRRRAEQDLHVSHTKSWLNPRVNTGTRFTSHTLF